MKSKNGQAHSHQLPSLRDPDYFGFFFIRHFLLIIAAILFCLCALVLTSMSYAQLDVTIKANAVGVEQCENSDRSCIFLSVSEKDSIRSLVGKPARIEISSDENYNRYMIEGKVTGIEKSNGYQSELYSHKVKVEVDASVYDHDSMNAVSGLIIVDEKPALDIFMDSVFDKISDPIEIIK